MERRPLRTRSTPRDPGASRDPLPLRQDELEERSGSLHDQSRTRHAGMGIPPEALRGSGASRSISSCWTSTSHRRCSIRRVIDMCPRKVCTRSSRRSCPSTTRTGRSPGGRRPRSTAGRRVIGDLATERSARRGAPWHDVAASRIRADETTVGHLVRARDRRRILVARAKETPDRLVSRASASTSPTSIAPTSDAVSVATRSGAGSRERASIAVGVDRLVFAG